MALNSTNSVGRLFHWLTVGLVKEAWSCCGSAGFLPELAAVASGSAAEFPIKGGRNTDQCDHSMHVLVKISLHHIMKHVIPLLVPTHNHDCTYSGLLR